MSVTLMLSCGGCDATTTTQPLRPRFQQVGHNRVRYVTDPEALTPEGWIMFDRYTHCTYCPACWAGITA